MKKRGRPAKKRPESDFDYLLNSTSNSNTGNAATGDSAMTKDNSGDNASSNVTDSNSSTPPPSVGESRLVKEKSSCDSSKTSETEV